MLRFRATRLLALAGLLAAAGCSDTPGTPSGLPDLSWLRAEAHPIRTAAPGGDDRDLAPLKQMVGDARIVALGEATHGTREFFQMKHRVLEYLVKEMGFNTFAIEATWAEANRLNDYVHHGTGDPEVLLSRLYFWTWNTREVLDMIEWMRRHNQSPGAAPRVSFFGFDMQYSRVTMDDVEAFVGEVAPADADSVRALYACYRRYQDEIGRPTRTYITEPDPARCRADVTAVHELLLRRRASYVQAAGEARYERAVRAARIVVQNEETRAVGGPAARDRFMAENAGWLLEQGGPVAKLVIWAHNYHVSVTDQGPSMGWHLRNRYGPAMVVLGFAFDRGSFTAVELAGGGGSLSGSLGVKTLSTPAAPAQSYEHQFHRLGESAFMIDLRRAPAGSWLHGPLPFRSIGCCYHPADPRRYFSPRVLPAEYDGIIYFERSSPSTRLSFRYF